MSPGHKLSTLISELVRFNNVDSTPRRKRQKKKEEKQNAKRKVPNLIIKVCIRARIHGLRVSRLDPCGIKHDKFIRLNTEL